MECKSIFFRILLGITVILILLGALTQILLPIYIQHQINQSITLLNNSLLYEAWLHPPVPIFLQFYLFNLLNPQEVSNGQKPVVQQIGPYTYQETRIKFDMVFDRENNEISYSEKKRYLFRPDLSSGSETDTIVQFNLAFIAVADLMKNNSKVIDRLIEIIMRTIGEQLFMTRTVSEMIWGYEDRLLHDLAQINIHPLGDTNLLGLFVGKNDSLVEHYTIKDGTKSHADLAKIISFDNKTRLTWWASEEANQINGTDGSFFRPGLQLGEEIFIFSSDICRSINLIAVDETQLYGINTLRFVAPSDLFQSPYLNPFNKGFCPNYPDCLKSGVLDLGPCLSGAPIIVSQPHFYQADPEYINAVIGMQPQAEFTTQLLVEPTVGTVMQASKKLQLNLRVQNSTKFSQLSKLRNTIMPLAFINESAMINDSLAQQLKHSFFTPIFAVKVVAIALVVAGSLIFSLLIVAIIYLRYSRNRREYVPIESD